MNIGVFNIVYQDTYKADSFAGCRLPNVYDASYTLQMISMGNSIEDERQAQEDREGISGYVIRTRSSPADVTYHCGFTRSWFDTPGLQQSAGSIMVDQGPTCIHVALCPDEDAKRFWRQGVDASTSLREGSKPFRAELDA